MPVETLEAQITRTLLPGMHLPPALQALFGWIEDNGLYIDRAEGRRIGFLFPEDALRESWTDDERQGGTQITFFAEGNANLQYWFGHARPEVIDRLCVFAKTGGEGSMAAFWLAPDGTQKIVHLGSGSGSVTVCVLADDALDFLRLLAIGYDEVCWGSELSSPPPREGEFIVHPNLPYQQWVREQFGATIPERGTEIVRHPDDMHRKDSADPFNRWVSASSA